MICTFESPDREQNSKWSMETEETKISLYQSPTKRELMKVTKCSRIAEG